MPYQTVNVPPELFMTHNGVNVYHTYKDDDISAGSRLFWYTLHPREDGDDAQWFDVRDLEVTVRPMDYDNHKRVIREALDSGRLDAPAPEDNLPWAHTVLVEVIGLAPDADAEGLVEKALELAPDTTRKLGLLPVELGTLEYDVTAL